MRNCNVRMFVVMVLIALWHGANCTFVAWGAYHALLLICVMCAV